ncbi:MAG: hypothetical protein KDD51_15755 [Bdellovibrionales bacterium]|nr:hypothetical protein [Bdellovibrionales bacterium]
MFRKYFVYLALFVSSLSWAVPKPGDWVGGAGIGLIFDGSLFLLTPQLEYIHDSTVRYGGLVQLGLASGTLATISGSLRYTFPTRRPKLQPFVEGALGLAIASLYRDSIGVHLMMAAGLDYDVTPDFTIGTTFRFNFAPPLDSFFVSWPIAVGRLRF